MFKKSLECGINYERLFHVKKEYVSEQAFLVRKKFHRSFSAHVISSNTTFAALFEQNENAPGARPHARKAAQRR